MLVVSQHKFVSGLNFILFITTTESVGLIKHYAFSAT